MNERKYDNTAITEYLLGALPEAAAERFDELSFTDEDFAAALSAAEKDLVDAYIHEELTGQKLEKFQNYYLASPLRREKVDFARNFQVLARENFTGTVENFSPQEAKPKRKWNNIFSAINIFKNRNLMQWSFAVLALAFVLAGGWWIIKNRLNVTEPEIARQETPAQVTQISPQPVENELSGNSNSENNTAPASKENESAQTNIKREQTNRQPVSEPTRTPKKDIPAAAPKISIASFILAAPLRGGSQIPNLSISKETTEVALQLELESADYASYRVVLMNESGKNLWRSGTLKAKNKGDDKVLNVRFPAKILKLKFIP